MEVLETVDREKLASLRERDEFFWLDLTDPAADDIKAMGEALNLHPVAVEDTIEFGQRPKLDSYGEHVLFVFYTVRKGRDGSEEVFEPVEVHIYVSGSFVITVRRAQCTQLDALHPELDAADPKAEDYIVYRVFDVLTDAFYPIIELLEERIDALEGRSAARPAAAGAPRRDLPPQAAHPRALAARRAAARPLPRRLRGHPHPAGARATGPRSTCATSATTSRRSPASCTASRRT